jgi:tetratricopeptide (TPR) repeat protein
LFLGGARAQLGDADGAKAAYLTYYKLNPKKADEYWDYCLKGHREQSRKALEKVILSRRERLDKGVSVARAYLDTHAGDTGGSGVDRELEQRGRGIVARKTGDDFALKGNYAKAISAYREAVNGGETLTEDSWQYFAIGVCRHEQGGYKEAIDAYRQALAAYPKRLEAWVGLDYALEDTEQFAAAREAIEKLAEYAAGTEFSRVSATLKTELPAIEAASEVRRQTLQESTGPAVQNSGADKKP